jgi:sugar phosphate isomerase/epimerase
MMARIPIGLQLYSIRENFKQDALGTLRAVSTMGYEGVEFFGGSYGGYAAGELRSLLADLGLRCCGSHTPLAALLGDAFSATADYAAALGNRYIVVPSLPEERRASLAEWRATADLFSGIAAQLAPYGIRLGFHNHTIELQPMAGQLPFDVFFSATGPDVFAQVDVGHVVHAGADPLHCLRDYPGRATTVHITEYSADGSALVGDHWPHWPEVFQLCETAGKTEWYIVEQESYPYPPLESARRCLSNMRRMGK